MQIEKSLNFTKDESVVYHSSKRRLHACMGCEGKRRLLKCGGASAQVNYFHFVAEEVRAGLASLGMRSMDELIGRADLLRQRPISLAKTEGLDLSFLTHFAGETESSSSRRGQEVRICHLSHLNTYIGVVS